MEIRFQCIDQHQKFNHKKKLSDRGECSWQVNSVFLIEKICLKILKQISQKKLSNFHDCSSIVLIMWDWTKDYLPKNTQWNLQKFRWSTILDPDGEFETFVVKTVIYGVRAAGNLTRLFLESSYWNPK